MRPLEKRFVYTGTAAGVGARFIRIDPLDAPAQGTAPNADYVAPVQGASCLPVTGGLSESTTGPYVLRVERPEPRVLLSVGGTRTRSGAQFPGERPYRVEVESSAWDVQIIERITVRSVRSRLVMTHADDGEYPGIVPDALELEGLMLDGHPVRVVTDWSPFAQCPTKHELRKAYRQLAAEYAEQFSGDPLDDSGLPETRKGLTVCTVVKDLQLGASWPKGIEKIGPNCLYWPDVGTIIVGELLIADHHRRLTMLRVRLGSPIEGDVSAGDVHSNSGTIP